jgi:hypothetical protein
MVSAARYSHPRPVSNGGLAFKPGVFLKSSRHENALHSRLRCNRSQIQIRELLRVIS